MKSTALPAMSLARLRRRADVRCADGINADACLSDIQIDDYLIGDPAADVAAHIGRCAACETRAERALAPIQGFASVTLAWSERRSATLPMQRLAGREFGWYQRLAWGASMAAALTVGVAMPVASHQAQMDDDANQTVSLHATGVPAPGMSEERVSEDNRMLQAIDNELSASAESPQALGLEPANASQRRTPRPLTVRD